MPKRPCWRLPTPSNTATRFNLSKTMITFKMTMNERAAQAVAREESLARFLAGIQKREWPEAKRSYDKAIADHLAWVKSVLYGGAR